MNDPHANNVESRPSRPVTFAEMTAGLVWPTLFRSVVMALAPGRLLVAFTLVVMLGALATGYDWVLVQVGSTAIAAPMLTSMSDGLDAFASQLLAFQPVLALTALYEGLFGGPLEMITTRPLTGVIFLMLVVPVWAVLGGAISRMVAADIAGHLYMTARDGVGFAFVRVLSLAGAIVLPLVGLGVLALVIALVGWVLLGIPAVNVFGSLLYGLVLLLGFLMTFLFAGFVVGHALLIPAVAIEGSDSLDAVQRTYAYVWGRPARAMAYAGFCLLQGAIVFALVRWFVTGAVELTGDLSTAWFGAEAAQALIDPIGEGEASLASKIIAGWNNIVLLVLPAFVISFYFSASTITYMLMRRINDEQDMHDIWMPGLVPGTYVPEIMVRDSK